MIRYIFSLIFLISTVNSQNFATSPSFSVSLISNNISLPRGLLIDESGDILVVSRGTSSVFALYPSSDDSTSFYSQSEIINGVGLGLNHGIAYNSGHLYVSAGSTVYRWPYTPGQREIIPDTLREIVISNISVPDENKQNTRTIIFDPDDLLYVTINSDIRIDLDSSRCRIRRFNISDASTLPIEFDNGELFADGVRNEVGLTFDSEGVLWGVENTGGIDYLIRDELGGFIHEGNPAEELNRFDQPPGTFYGYPYCFASYGLEGYPIGAQFAWPTAMSDGIHSDEWCQQPENNHPAEFHMAAHQAPLGLEFYDGSGCDAFEGAFPCSLKGNLIIAYHGSMNISTVVGYKVVMYNWDSDLKIPTGEPIDIVYDIYVKEEDKLFRPVNAVFDKEGHLIVTSDKSNEIVRISYKTSSPPQTTPSNSEISLLIPNAFMSIIILHYVFGFSKLLFK